MAESLLRTKSKKPIDFTKIKVYPRRIDYIEEWERERLSKNVAARRKVLRYTA